MVVGQKTCVARVDAHFHAHVFLQERLRTYLSDLFDILGTLARRYVEANNHNSNDATDKNKLQSMVVVKVLTGISSSENQPKSQ